MQGGSQSDAIFCLQVDGLITGGGGGGLLVPVYSFIVN